MHLGASYLETGSATIHKTNTNLNSVPCIVIKIYTEVIAQKPLCLQTDENVIP